MRRLLKEKSGKIGGNAGTQTSFFRRTSGFCILRPMKNAKATISYCHTSLRKYFAVSSLSVALLRCFFARICCFFAALRHRSVSRRNGGKTYHAKLKIHTSLGFPVTLWRPVAMLLLSLGCEQKDYFVSLTFFFVFSSPFATLCLIPHFCSITFLFCNSPLPDWHVHCLRRCYVGAAQLPSSDAK